MAKKLGRLDGIIMLAGLLAVITIIMKTTSDADV